MPKEKIRGLTDSDIHVGWQSDCCHMQIGIELPDDAGQHLLDRLYGGQTYEIGLSVARRFDLKYEDKDPDVTIANLNAIGESVLGLMRERAPYTGFWMTIVHRQVVNNLIRVLRRARDSAFGKDE